MENNIKCERCKTKNSDIQCMNCDSFRNLCSRCDSVVHSLPTKQNHRRIPTNDHSSSPPQVMETNIEKEQVVLPSMQQPLLPQSNANTILSSKFYYSNQYTKAYLNEIKSVFMKEKNELEFKNKTLQNNLDRLKLSFTEQMNTLSSELKDIQTNNTITINALKNNYEKEIERLHTQHQIEIESLRNDITMLEQNKTEQSELMMKDQEDSSKHISSLNQRISDLEMELQAKDGEIFKLKNSFDVVMCQNEQMLKEQRRNIIEEYETKIEGIVKDVEETKDKLIKLIDNREIDIKNIVDSNKMQIQNLNEEITKLKEEIECHKVNLVKVRDERDYLQSQINSMKQNENAYICDNQMQINEINRLADDNKRLNEENDQLKIQLSKLDKLIYGKIRPNCNW
jgi:N-terminal acetyltransferase B complex non-catalytic subunit